MKPVDQTILSPRQYDGKTFGNCVQACLASLMEVPIELVPFCPHPERLGRSKDMAAFGFGMYKTDSTDPRQAFQGFHMMCGIGPRTQLGLDGVTEFPMYHAVVGFAGEMVHDPHPSRAGLKTCDEFYWLIALEPTALKFNLRRTIEECNKAAEEFRKSCIVTREQMQKPYTV